VAELPDDPFWLEPFLRHALRPSEKRSESYIDTVGKALGTNGCQHAGGNPIQSISIDA
jgi:hypothetical protein